MLYRWRERALASLPGLFSEQAAQQLAEKKADKFLLGAWRCLMASCNSVGVRRGDSTLVVRRCSLVAVRNRWQASLHIAETIGSRLRIQVRAWLEARPAERQ
jgi:hypothetical protein